MKYLNFLSLLPILLIIGIFAGSPEISEDINKESNIHKEFVLEIGYLLPLEVSDQATDLVDEHISNMSASLELTYINNHTVGQLLVHFGKANDVVHNLSDTDNLSEIDLSKVLTKEELDIVNSNLLKSSPEIQSQDCIKIYKWSNCCWRDRVTGNCVGAWCGNGCWPANCGC